MRGNLGVLAALAVFPLGLFPGCSAGNGPGTLDDPPPIVVGPRAVLLRTPHAVGNAGFDVSLAYSPDGKTVAAGRIESATGRIEDETTGTAASLCDLATGRERITIEGPVAEACAVAFSPDGHTLAMGLDRSVRLYDPGTGTMRAELACEDAFGTFALAFTRDGQRLAAVTSLGKAVLLEVEAHRELRAMKSHMGNGEGVAISPDSRWVATASQAPMVGRSIGPFGLPARYFGTVVTATISDGGLACLFDIATGEQRGKLRHNGRVRGVAFSPDGEYLASAGGGEAKLWDLATDEARILVTAEPELDVFCVAFSPDGRSLALGLGSSDFDGTQGEVRLWDMALGRVRAVLRGGEAGRIRALAFAPDGRTLVTGSRRAVVLWDVPPSAD